MPEQIGAGCRPWGVQSRQAEAGKQLVLSGEIAGCDGDAQRLGRGWRVEEARGLEVAG